jgi:hypothetical protein
LEIIVESELANKDQIAPLWKEGNELTSIFVKMLKTAKSNSNKM